MDPEQVDDRINNLEDKVQAVDVGYLENTDPNSIVRIIHVSDTHLAHDKLIPDIPEGDILIHSGDFLNHYYPSHVKDLLEDVSKINNFFGKLPHRHKIFVAGNHESSLYCFGKQTEIISSQLTNGIYLQDKKVTILGITIHGTPWNNADMAYYEKELQHVWAKVPANIDILVTHLPPFGIRDLGYNKRWGLFETESRICDLCTAENSDIPVYHGEFDHHGCRHLKKDIFERIRPKAHLFGHIHNQNGISWKDGILFSNGAVTCKQRPIIIDFHKHKDKNLCDKLRKFIKK